MQSHKHRAEKWEIVQGVAEVTVGDIVAIYSAGQNIEIPLGALHRLKNAGTEQLLVKETQLGEVLD